MSVVSICVKEHGVTDSLDRMMEASCYWNPERQETHIIDQRIGLGFSKFVNAPQSRSEKIHASSDGQIFCIANARLDNRTELAELLNLSDCPDVADGAFILAAYQKFGEGCARNLLGDFVFTVVDLTQQIIVVGRDHLGIKNIFYGVCEGELVISNEHNALRQSGVVSNRFNPEFLFDAVFARRSNYFISPIEDIKTCLAAHYTVFDLKNLKTAPRIERYWELKVHEYPQCTTEQEWLIELEQRFQTAVKHRLVSTAPIGCELSEGLDSTGIAAVAAQSLPNEKILTYSYDVQRMTPENESKYIATYQDIFDFLEMYPNLEAQWADHAVDVNLILSDISKHFGAPSPHSGQPHTRYPLARDRGVRTLLSGWGGDHCVSSNGGFFEDELFKAADFKELARYLEGRKKRGREGSMLRSLAKFALKYGCRPLFRRIQVRRAPIDRGLYLAAKYHPFKAGVVPKSWIEEGKYRALHYQTSSVRERDYRELYDVGIESRVFGSEVVARYYRLEYRYPLYDKELIEFAYSMPSYLKAKDGVERFAFREVLRGKVTERIRTRVKSDVVTPGDGRAHMETKRENVTKQFAKVQDHPLFQRYIEPEKIHHILATMPVSGTRKVSHLCELAEQMDALNIKLPEK